MRKNLLHLAQRLANLPEEVKEDLKDPNSRGGSIAGLSVGSPLTTMKAKMSDAGSFKRSTRPTRKSKRSTQPTRKSNRKKSVQTTVHTPHSSQNHTPSTVPSDIRQVDTNQTQTTQFESIQSQSQPQSTLPQPTQPQPIPLKQKKYAQTALGTSHSSQNRIPLTIPSDVLQAVANQPQTTQFESVQLQSQPQSTLPQPSQPRTIPLKQKKYARTALGTSHSSQNRIPLTIPSNALQAVLQALTNQIQTAQLESVQPQPQPQPTQLQPMPLIRKRYARKKSSQTHTPLTIPSDATLQADTNQTQTTHFETIQPQPTQPQLSPTQIPHMQEYPMVNRSPSSSCHVSGGDNGNKIMILPEGDGFDKHKLVVGTIASCIRSKFEEAQPSWKKFSQEQRDIWFDIFKSKFTWPPEYDDIVRRNFEKRGSAKMIQLMQEVRKNLNKKPNWIREPVWTQLKAQWESSSFKEKSEINKRNRDAMAGASLHTGGSMPHHLHWKRMKEEKGTDPSFSEFYFRTHRKKDHSWVGPHAKYAYEKYERRKSELFSQFPNALVEDNGGSSQQSIGMPSEIDIWVDSVGGKKKGKVSGLGSIGKTLIPSSSRPAILSSDPEDVDELRKEVQSLNGLLQRQEHEKLEMRKELSKTKKQLATLMQHLGFVGSSHPSSSSQHSNEEEEEEYEDDDDEDYAD